MNIPRLFLIFVVAFFCAVTTRAEDKLHYRVQLKVSGSENDLAEITSFMTRELRRIGDVEVVENDPLFVISVIALSTSNRAGAPTGYTLSVVVEMPVRYHQVRGNIAKAVDENQMKFFDVYFNNTTRLLSHLVQVGGSDRLETLCKKIIASIDGSDFENHRKFVQQFREFQKNQTIPTK